MKIVDHLIGSIFIKGKIRSVSSDEVVPVQKLSLFDKYLTKGNNKSNTSPPEERRYRILLDCRPFSPCKCPTLRYSDRFLAGKLDAFWYEQVRNHATNETNQSQKSALFFVESIPRSSRRYSSLVC
jgi:hypothetical protein